MHVEVLVAEIGSTTTVVNAFGGIHGDAPSFIGQGQAPTSVMEGDVNLGLSSAIDDLAKHLGADTLTYDELLATSSAAGGLKMTVHGLVFDMTARAAKEAALGAGANLHMVTAGKLRRSDLKRIEEIRPNIILIAGGVDYGERQTAIDNAEAICKLNLKVPVIYAGNVENQEEIRLIFEDYGLLDYLSVVDNVYPKIDVLNVEPTRKVIQEVFERHIIHAPGMDHIKDMVNGPIIPTPGAVMEASKLLEPLLGDLMTVDVGGATTDLHSVAEGSEEISRHLISPEPKAKRTVEGDLGVYVNLNNILSLIGSETLAAELSLTEEEVASLVKNHPPIPVTDLEKRFVGRLAKEAVLRAAHRHAGGFRSLYGGEGKKILAEGKDLTGIKAIIGTGGALTRLPDRIEILKAIAPSNKGDKLLPNEEAKIYIDNDYIMASLGVLSKEYPESALALLKKSLRLEEDRVSTPVDPS